MSNADARTMTGQPDEQEEAPIRHIQTVSIHHEKPKNRKTRYWVSITPSIRAAGLDGDAVFRFIPEEADELGVVPALGSEEGGGNRRDNRTYSVRPGATDSTLRLTVPEAALEALGIETEAAQGDELPMLDVYSGDYMIAFDKSSAQSLPADSLPDEYGNEEVILEQIQTATPRMRSWGDVAASVSPALKSIVNDAGAVEFHPELADDLDGLVPAIVYPHGDGRARGDARSVYHEGHEKQDLSVPLPADVLAALGLSADDYEDVPVDERPSLTVYAGGRVIAFGRPGERNVTVDRAQTPRQPAPTLTDIDGIGPALADELATRGFETVADLKDATREDLLAIPQLGDSRADRILDDIRSRMDEDGDE